VLFATVGALIGAYFNYFLSKIIGRPLIHSFAESRIGRICMLSSEKVTKAEEYFEKHGAISTFFGRLIPAVRQLISVPAGLAKMKLLTFTIFTALGAGIWNIVLALLGYWLSLFVPEADLFNQIEHYNKYLTYAGYALALLIVAYVLYHMLKKKSKK
jgi:membrane protein DedA with SNARE-associated domain